jgi:hypothetical protein
VTRLTVKPIHHGGAVDAKMWSPAGPQSLEPLLRQSHDYRPEVTVLLQSLLTFACRGTKIKAQKEGEEQQQAAFPIFFLIQQSQATMGGVSSNTLKKQRPERRRRRRACGRAKLRPQDTAQRKTEQDSGRSPPPKRRNQTAESTQQKPNIDFLSPLLSLPFFAITFLCAASIAQEPRHRP